MKKLANVTFEQGQTLVSAVEGIACLSTEVTKLSTEFSTEFSKLSTEIRAMTELFRNLANLSSTTAAKKVPFQVIYRRFKS